MLSRIAVLLAVASVAAWALHTIIEKPEDRLALEQEVAGQLDALREHLFKR